MVTVSECPKAMRSVLLIMLFILICFGAGGTQGQTRRIPDDEMTALVEIAEQLGKKDWNLSLNECDENGNWLPPVKYGLTYKSNVNCTCLGDGCHISAIFWPTLSCEPRLKVWQKLRWSSWCVCCIISIFGGVMASSSSSGTRSPLRIRLCNHGKEAVVHTSWTDQNPGRRFFGCPLWVPGAPKRNGPHCNYFDWLDGEVGDEEKVDRRVQRDTRSLNKRIEEYERMMVEYETNMEESEFKCKEQEMKCKEYERKMEEFEKKINDLEAKVWKTTGMMWGAWVACSILVVIIFAIISTGRGFEKKSLGWRR